MKAKTTSTKRINRLALLQFIANKQSLAHVWQEPILGNNIWFLGNDKEEPYLQLEFIPESKLHSYTIAIQGLQSEEGADPIHNDIVTYIKELKLNRNIFLGTDSIFTLI